jgi:hypothetical protein
MSSRATFFAILFRRVRPDNEHGHLSFKLVLRANLVRIPSACGWYLLTVVRGPILVATISASSDAVFFSTAGTSEFFILSQSGERLGGATHTARFYCHNGSTCCWSQGRCAPLDERAGPAGELPLIVPSDVSHPSGNDLRHAPDQPSSTFNARTRTGRLYYPLEDYGRWRRSPACRSGVAAPIFLRTEATAEDVL